MSNLYEKIKDKSIKIDDVYENNEGHRLTISAIMFYQDTETSKALNWTFTLKLQGVISYSNNEEVKGITSSSIIRVDYAENSFKQFKDYEKYILSDKEFPSSSLIKKK